MCFNSWDALTYRLWGDANVDSDCEDGAMGTEGGAPRTKEEKDEQARAVFTTGSFSAYVNIPSFILLERNDELSSWKALFFYRCTDIISFAPLKSQGADSRSSYIRAMNGSVVPPPCSPKSIYVLASLVSKPWIRGLAHDTDVSVEVRNPASLRQCIRRHQEQGIFGQCRGRGFLVGHCKVRVLPRMVEPRIQH